MSQTHNTEPEPTRPNWKWLLAIILAVVAVGVADNWSEVSELAHLPQIAHSLGIG